MHFTGDQFQLKLQSFASVSGNYNPYNAYNTDNIDRSDNIDNTDNSLDEFLARFDRNGQDVLRQG